VVVATLNKRTGGKEMNRKFLEQLGLTEEQVEAVMSEHGKSTQDLQAKVSAAEDNAKGLQDQLKERDKDMKQLKKDAEGNADLQQKYSDLDSKYKTQQKEHEQQLKTMQLDHAIEMIVQAPLSAQLAMVYLAFFSSALGFVFWSYAFEHAEKVSDVTNFMYISPIVAAIVAAFLLGEFPNMGLYIGAPIILGSLFLFNRYR